MDWFFQSEIPIRYAELTTQFPKPFQFAIQYQGGPDPEPICKDNTFKGIQFAEHLFILKNVPALKEECCITTMNDYYSRVRYISTSPQSTWKLLLKDLFQKPEWVGKVTESQRQLVLEEAFIDTNANLKQQEIAYKLYNYLNDKFIWNGKYGIGTEQSIDETLKSKTANSGDLNKVMLAGLQQAGIDVKPVLISTRDNGKINEHLPLLQQFNHMVLLARIDGRETWIDMGDPYLPIGTLRPNSLNGRGLIVSVENPDFVNISSAESTTLFLIKGDIDSTGKFSGTIESRYAGYHARKYRISSQADRKNYAKTILLSQGKTIPISDMEYINPIITVLPYHTRGKIKAWPIADITEGKMRINLLHPHFFQSLPVNVEKRTYPVEINYPEEIAFMMELTIPDSYAIETLPDFYNSNRNGLVISADATSIGNQVLLKFVVDMNKIFFQPEEFPLLQKSLNELHQMLDEKIILTKLK